MDTELPKMDDGMANFVLKTVMPPLIRNLLAEGLLDKSKLHDKEYILGVIQENSHIFDEMGVGITIHDHFIESARDAIAANRPEVVVVLIATALEQMINTFYRQVLQEKETLTDDEITELIRNSNTNAKFGWLLTLVSGYEIYDDFRKEISNFMELRNQIVHYKAVMMTTALEQPPLKKRIQDFGLERIMEIPDDLSELLNDALESVRKETPDYDLAMEAVKLFVE